MLLGIRAHGVFLFVMLLTLVVLGTACTQDKLGSSAAGPQTLQGLPANAVSPELPADARSIPFPPDHHSSGLTEYVLSGSSAELRSPGAVEQGSALVLAADAGSFEYALYRFNPAEASLPDSLSVLFEELATTAAYVGIADYAAGHWAFSGPYAKQKTIAIDEPDYISPEGNLWIAVVAADSSAATVNALSVRTINPDNVAPTAALSVSDEDGNAPFTAEFSAAASSDSDGSIIEYAWDWEDDGIYDGFSESSQVSHQYLSSGLRTARMRVTDDQFARATATVQLDVNAVPLATIFASPADAEVFDTVYFDATGSSDTDGEIANVFWDLDNDGTFEHFTGSALKTPVQFLEPGEPSVGVRITDDNGAQATAYAVATIHGWSIVTVDATPLVGQHCSLAVIAGNPAISYIDDNTDDLKYARSSTPTGQDDADWTPTVVDDAEDSTGFFTSLASVLELPAISYFNDTDDTLNYAICSVPDGTSPADWTHVVVDATAAVGSHCSLDIVSSKPAISYRDSTNTSLKYTRSNTSSGSAAEDWNQPVTVDNSGDVGRYTSLEVVANCPAISYTTVGLSQLKYARSYHIHGAEGTWLNVIVADVTIDSGYHSSLKVVAGHPAIGCFSNVNLNAKYLRSTTNTGNSQADWSQIVSFGATSDVGQFTSLAVIDGRPALAYFDESNDLPGLVYSLSPNGALVSDWQRDSDIYLYEETEAGWWTSLAEVDGKPAMCYYDITDAVLKYAIRF
jgi:hypothetical protein